jgi:hypothetical protein
MGQNDCDVAGGDQESGWDVGFFVLNLKCMYCPSGEKIGNETAYKMLNERLSNLAFSGLIMLQWLGDKRRLVALGL